MDVWTEAEHWNVGMKFGEEGTMKNVWMGAARVRKVKKKKGIVNIQRSEGWELGQRLDRKTNWNEFSTDCSQTFTKKKSSLTPSPGNHDGLDALDLSCWKK